MLFLLLSTANEEQKEKFEQLYLYYRDFMMYIVNGIISRKSIAEEAVQEAFIKILLNIDDIDEVNCRQTKSFILLITKSVAINKLKYENRRNHIEDNVLEYSNVESCSLEDIAIQNITVANVLEAIKKLDEKYREIIILRYYYGYTDDKIAQHFNISPALVRKRCERGKKKIMFYLSEEGGGTK
jgi:RNA polymerase sigma-70 factor (ECF subfamily)